MLTVLGGGYGLTGLLFHWISFRPAGRAATEQYRGIVAPFFASPGTIFALMTAFLGSGVWDALRTGTQAVMQEREGIVSDIELSEAAPGSMLSHLPHLAKDYAKSVVDVEWKSTRGRMSTHATDAKLNQLMTAVADPAIGRVVGSAVQGALINAVQRISAARVIRLALLGRQTEDLRWVCVLVLGLLAQASVAAVHLDRRKPQAPALVLSTTAIVIALGLVALTERPFSGSLAISPAPLQHILENPGG